MFSCFSFMSRKKSTRNTKEMDTKPKRLKLLFAIICNNLVKRKKEPHTKMIELHLYSTWNSHQTHIKVKTKQCMHICIYGEVRAKWRIAQCSSDDGYPVISVHLSKMERTDLPSPATSSSHSLCSLVCAPKRFAVLFACRWEWNSYSVRAHLTRLRALFSHYFFTKQNLILSLLVSPCVTFL